MIILQYRTLDPSIILLHLKPLLDQLILVDFKTDYVGKENGAKEKIVEKYKTQLEIYQKALEQALNRKVDKVVLCLANANWEEVIIS